MKQIDNILLFLKFLGTNAEKSIYLQNAKKDDNCPENPQWIRGEKELQYRCYIQYDGCEVMFIHSGIDSDQNLVQKV